MGSLMLYCGGLSACGAPASDDAMTGVESESMPSGAMQPSLPPAGSTTTIVNDDGSVTVLTTDEDGNTTATTTDADGTVTTMPVTDTTVLPPGTVITDPSAVPAPATATPPGSATAVTPAGTGPAAPSVTPPTSPSATAPDPGPGTPPPNLPGVVLGSDPDGDGVSEPTCFALCASTEVDPDGDGDDWFYENTASCVLPVSATAMNAQACTTGQPVPEPEPLTGPGVVVDGACVRLCTNPDPDMDDDWGWELEASCVYPTSVTATAGAACMLGEAVPVVSAEGLPGRLIDGVCNPYCQNEASDAAGAPAGDGWGWEYNLYACIVEGSAPAATGLDCVVGTEISTTAPPLNPNPPAGDATRPAGNTSTGFFVADGKLYDAYGNEFVMRGINNPHIWFDPANQFLAYSALDNIAALGTNTIRIVWETTGEAALLRQVIARIVELDMIPMVELHDVTGGTSNADLTTMAAYYAQADVKAVLVDFEGYLLVNIANEWSGTDFRNAYSAAITQLRSAGINHTLVIDANGYGQDASSIFNNGTGLLNDDPQHNLLFGIHMYANYSSTATITSTLEQAASSGLAVMVGEFGNSQSNINPGHLMSECARLGLGYLAWSWKGNNADLAYLDLAVDWEGAELTAWGDEVFGGSNGITSTAQPASVFEL